MRSQEIITAIIAVTVKMGGFTFNVKEPNLWASVILTAARPSATKRP